MVERVKVVNVLGLGFLLFALNDGQIHALRFPSTLQTCGGRIVVEERKQRGSVQWELAMKAYNGSPWSASYYLWHRYL